MLLSSLRGLEGCSRRWGFREGGDLSLECLDFFHDGEVRVPGSNRCKNVDVEGDEESEGCSDSSVHEIAASMSPMRTPPMEPTNHHVSGAATAGCFSSMVMPTPREMTTTSGIPRSSSMSVSVSKAVRRTDAMRLT